MKRSLMIFTGGFILVAWLHGIAQFRASAQEPDPRIKRVFDDWIKRQAAVKAMLMQASGTQMIAKGSLAESLKDVIARKERKYPERDVECKVSQLLLLDLAKGRYRFDEDRPQFDIPKRDFYPQYMLKTFNGRFTASFQPRQKNTHPKIGIREGQAEFTNNKGYLGESYFQRWHWPMLVGVGIVPTSFELASPLNLKVTPDPERLHFHATTIHENRPCIILRTRPTPNTQVFDEYWIDRERLSAVVRMVYHAYGNALSQTDISYKEYPLGWFPSGWAFQVQQSFDSSKVSYSESIKVDQLVINPIVADDEFELEPKPGQRLKEFMRPAPSAPGESRPSTPYKLFEIMDDGTRKLIDSGGSRGPNSMRIWLWIGVGAIFPSSVTYWWYARRRHRHGV